jgi:hypothetical protein
MLAMTETGFTIADPRKFPDRAAAPSAARALHALAEASLAAESGHRSGVIDRELIAALGAALAADGEALAAAIAAAPSVPIARHLWRSLDAAWRETAVPEGAGLAVNVFALPLVIVTGLEGAGGDGELPAVLASPARLAAILTEFDAVGGNRTITLANTLVAAGAIDILRLPEIAAWCRLPDVLLSEARLPERVLAPAPLVFHAGRESVHLRFLVGTAVAKPGADLLADSRVGEWGAPLARELGAQSGTGGVSVLVLPRAPARLLPAVAHGRSAQREVSAQIFASNAIRRFRGTVGEPTAIISAHRAPDAPEGGELRLSLSSALDPRAAEGFRCPLYPIDRAGDVASMLVDLLRDCRVTDVRVVPGVHPDRAAGTGLPLLFKPETIPPHDFAVH